MAGGVAGAAAASLVTGRNFGDTLIASLPSVIGNTVGNLVADRVARGGSVGSGNADDDINSDLVKFTPEERAAMLPGSVRTIDPDVALGFSGGGIGGLADEIVVAGQRRNESVGASSQVPSSFLTGLSLTRNQYLDAVKDGLWAQVQGVEASPTGFSNNAAVNAAAKRAQALPPGSTADLQASPDLAAFLEAIGLTTAGARIGGTDQDYEKFLTFGRNADNEIVVTAISVVGKQGGNIESLGEPREIPSQGDELNIGALFKAKLENARPLIGQLGSPSVEVDLAMTSAPREYRNREMYILLTKSPDGHLQSLTWDYVKNGLCIPREVAKTYSIEDALMRLR